MEHGQSCAGISGYKPSSLIPLLPPLPPLPRSRPVLQLNLAFPISVTAGRGAPVFISVASSSLPGDAPRPLPPLVAVPSRARTELSGSQGWGEMAPAACVRLETGILVCLFLSPRKRMVLLAGEQFLCSSRDQKPHPTLSSTSAVAAKGWFEDC